MTSELDWYAIVSEPQREEVAQRALRQIGLVTYVAWCNVEVRRRHSRVSMRRRVFPGYVFVGMEYGREPWLRIDDCSAVLGIVGFGDPLIPERVDPLQIGDLMCGVWRGRYDGVRSRNATLRPGVQVRLRHPDADDVYATRVGRIMHVKSNERIMVMFGSDREQETTTIVSKSLDELVLV